MNKYSNLQMKRANYEVTILLITILSLFNLFIYYFASDKNVVQLALQMNFILSLIFLADFFFRLRTATNNRDYFIRQNGWLDLLGSVPIPGFSLARVKHMLQVIRGYRRVGSRELLRLVLANRADTALLTIGLCVIYILEFGSIFILRAESEVPGSEIKTAADALWWVLVTISTVGYGDLVPITNDGRFVSTFVILAGVGVFGTLSGFLAKTFLGDTETSANIQAKENTTAILNEIRKLREVIESSTQKQEETNAGFHDRLASLESELEERSSDS